MNKKNLTVKGILFYITFAVIVLTISGMFFLTPLTVILLLATRKAYKNLSDEEIFYSLGITWLQIKYNNNEVIQSMTTIE